MRTLLIALACIALGAVAGGAFRFAAEGLPLADAVLLLSSVISGAVAFGCYVLSLVLTLIERVDRVSAELQKINRAWTEYPSYLPGHPYFAGGSPLDGF